MNGEDVMEVALEAGPDVRPGAPTRLFARPPLEGLTSWFPYLQVSGDGENFYMLASPVGGVGRRPLTCITRWSADHETRSGS